MEDHTPENQEENTLLMPEYKSITKHFGGVIEDNEFIHYSEDYRIHYIACVTVEAVVNVDESSSWSESESNYTIFWLLTIDCNMIAI